MDRIKTGCTPVLGGVLITLLTHSALGEEITVNRIQKSFPHALPGKAVVLEKVYDTKTQRASLHSDQSYIRNPEDLASLETAEFLAARKRMGNLSRYLHDRVQGAKNQAEIQVLVSVKQAEGILYPSKFEYPEEELKIRFQAINTLKPPVSVETILARYAVTRLDQGNESSAILKATPATLKRMAADPDIASIDYYEPPKTAGTPIWSLGASLGQATINLNTLARSAYSHSQAPLPGNLANGVRAATFENGLTPAFLSANCLNISPAYYDLLSGPNYHASIHSLGTFTNLVNSAPGASFYHRKSMRYDRPEDQNFIIDNAIRTVSLSVKGPGIHDPTHIQNRYIDDFAFRHPYPVFSTPTANDGWLLVPEWAAYNVLNVGNVQDSAYVRFKIDTITCGGGATQTRNPKPVHGGCIDGGIPPDCTGDREMPYLVAPGYTPFGKASHPSPPCYEIGVIGMTTPCISQGQKWGTSMSAPTVNGIAASLMGRNPYLIGYPELVRAILLNTARNVHGAEWNQSQDGKDGAGVIHGQDAIAFATNLPSVSPGNSPVSRGYYYSLLTQSNFGTPLYFNVAIPNPRPSGQHLRVVLTWNSMPSLIWSSNILQDIDLYVTSYSNFRYSSSSDSNIEIVDFPASETPAGTTATIQVYPAIWRRVDNSRVNFTYVALTWGFVANHAQ